MKLTLLATNLYVPQCIYKTVNTSRGRETSANDLYSFVHRCP